MMVMVMVMMMIREKEKGNGWWTVPFDDDEMMKWWKGRISEETCRDTWPVEHSRFCCTSHAYYGHRREASQRSSRRSTSPTTTNPPPCHTSIHEFISSSHYHPIIIPPPTFFIIISGARYSGVPHRLFSSSPDTSALDRPKSVILICPSASSSKFSGFKSR